MKMDIINVLVEKGMNLYTNKAEQNDIPKDYQYLLKCVQEMLNNANALFNFAADQDLVEIAIYQQILAEKWLNYIFKLHKLCFFFF